MTKSGQFQQSGGPAKENLVRKNELGFWIFEQSELFNKLLVSVSYV